MKPRVESFTDPTVVPGQPLLVVHGKAAVGKTRSLYEALNLIKAAAATTVYTGYPGGTGPGSAHSLAEALGWTPTRLLVARKSTSGLKRC